MDSKNSTSSGGIEGTVLSTNPEPPPTVISTINSSTSQISKILPKFNMNSPQPRNIRLGVMVPSSNTVLEPLTQRIVASIIDPQLRITVHFARFRVTKIELSLDANSQFNLEAMLVAAQLLADAHVDVIGWSGTSASWLGFSSDESLCSAIEATTGIPATTSVLAMNIILHRRGTRNVGLITPYMRELQNAIRKNYEDDGISIQEQRSRCAGLTTNFSFAALGQDELDLMVADVVRNGAESVLVLCTNVAAVQRAKFWEDQYGIFVLDSVATVLHGMLEKLQVKLDPDFMKEWGSIFDSK
jgi:maleate isomerase